MTNHETTQLARTPLLLLDYAGRHGMDRMQLMDDSELSPETLADPDSRVPTKAIRKLWHIIIEHEQDLWSAFASAALSRHRKWVWLATRCTTALVSVRH